MFDASTTGVSEVVLHYHRQPTEMACLGCIYDEAPDEVSRERHIADLLGVTLEEVQRLLVDEGATIKIHAKYALLSVIELKGQAYDSLFKALCSDAALRSPEQRQVFAPFAFVSEMAGTYLVVELAQRFAICPELLAYNYWRISPWSAPVRDLKQSRRPSDTCVVCSKPSLRRLRANLWTEPSQVFRAMPTDVLYSK